MRHLRSARLGAAVLLAIAAHELGAQTSELYLTGSGGVAVVQNGVVRRHWAQTNNSAYAIAVGSTVRTIGGLGATSGFEYLLTGTPTGVSYSSASVLNQTSYDGASDGTSNYFLSWNSQWVYRTGLDWSTPTRLFQVSTTPTSNAGLTYDPTSNSLWVGAWGAGVVKHFSMSGQLLGTFATQPRNVTGLAFDRADNTLWMSDYVVWPNTLFQYSLGGTLLQRVAFETVGFGPMRVLGAEFGAPPARAALRAASVPEPGTTTLLVVGLTALGAAGWRRRRAGA